MRLLLRWVLPTMVLAAVLHVVLVWRAPEIMTGVAVRLIAGKDPVRWNTLFRWGLVKADNPVRAPSPDIVYSSAFYDVTDLPVRIHCVIPQTGNYWSVSLYAWNTDNFFVENDRTAPAAEFDLILTGPGTHFQPRGGERAIVSPTTRGVAALRAIISDRNNPTELAQIAEAQRKSLIEPVVPRRGE